MKFTLVLWDRGIVAIEMPSVNGGINTGEYFPTSIITSNSQSAFTTQAFQGMASCSDPQDVKKDLEHMAGFINYHRANLKDINSFISAIGNSVTNHIKTYGRIFFSDLCTYIDLAAHIMNVCGFSKKDIYIVYIWSLYEITRVYNDSVKEGNPMFGIIPFSSTAVYRNVTKIATELFENAG